MNRFQLYAAGVAVALVPAVVGIAGNASFSQSVPVRTPDQARATHATPSARPTADRTDGPTHDVGDDHGRRHGGHGADDGPTHDVGDDHGRRHGGHGTDDGPNHDLGDDHGGDRDRIRSDDDSGHHSGRDDGGHHHSGGDDSGHGGHGSDD